MVTARHQAILDAILDAPGDDELRGVYADLLEQEGDEIRAEFIRAQLAGEAGAARAEALEAAHGPRFAGVIASHAKRWTFARGLVAAISADLVTLGAQLATLLAAAPIRTIRLIDSDEDEEHEDHEQDEGDNEEQDEAQGGTNRAGDENRSTRASWPARRLDAARSLAGCARLASIETIDATFGSFEAEPLDALLGSAFLTRLGRLVLGRDTNLAAVRAIAAAHPRLPALRALCCFPESAAVNDEGAAALAASPLLAQLEILELWGTGIGPGGAEALFGAPALDQLRHLALAATVYEANPIGPRGAQALARARLARLTTLELGGAAIEDAGLAAIAAAPWLAHVETLDLDDNQLTDHGLRALARSPYAAGLTQLSIGRNQALARTIAELEQLPRLARLRYAGPWRALR
jgi:uncharacterized protein (TIGR02996 family)